MESINEMAEQLKLLGDRTRLTMLALLQQREWCVCEFVEIFAISQPGISQHIRKMRARGLVREERRGQWVYYSLNIVDKPHIQALLQALPEPAELLREMGKTQLQAICAPNTGGCCS
ncbi:transcriptional regulator [Saccharibacillus sp. O16]|nr:transcriptional regulator [Saccharibacillus sp. O16]